MNKVARLFELSPRRGHRAAVSFRLFVATALVLLLPLSSLSIAADRSAVTAQELEQVGSAIGEIQSWLEDAKQQYSNEENQLQSAEQEIAQVSQAAASTTQAVRETEERLSQLRSQIEQLEADKSQQSEILAQVIRAAYMTGEQSALKLILNQQDLSQSARLLHYQRIFSEAQIEKIETYQQVLDEIAVSSADLEAKANTLEVQQRQLDEELLALNAARSTRETALNALRSSIGSRSSELEQLQIDRAELQALLEEIAKAMERVQSVADLPPFTERQGVLPMPAEGPVIRRYGQSYGEGSLTRQGITIEVEEGTAVHAVHPGRVVFADWLRGSGLLVILDHGDGYMSLYGANQALAKSPGDWVDQGEVLATSGVATDATSGVYFEIRHHGTPQNPSNWIQR